MRIVILLISTPRIYCCCGTCLSTSLIRVMNGDDWGVLDYACDVNLGQFCHCLPSIVAMGLVGKTLRRRSEGCA